MLYNNIIKKSKSDRKAYEIFVLLGVLYDSTKENVNLDAVQTTEDDEVQFMKVLRGTLISLNDIKFEFFSDIMKLIDFIDKTSIFGETYTARQFIDIIENILNKLYCQFDWCKDIAGIQMTNEEILELLDYDCDIEDFKEALEMFK